MTPRSVHLVLFGGFVDPRTAPPPGAVNTVQLAPNTAARRLLLLPAAKKERSR